MGLPAPEHKRFYPVIKISLVTDVIILFRHPLNFFTNINVLIKLQHYQNIYPMDPNRLRRLNVRLSQQEWDKVHKLASNTTCRSTSEYARKLLTGKPVRVFYRNQSFDELEQQMIRLLPRLETFATNFAQAIQMPDSGEKMPTANSIRNLLQCHSLAVSKALS